MRDEAWFKEHPEVDRYEYHRGASGSWYESFIDTRNGNAVISGGGHPTPCPPLLAPDVGGYFDALIANGMPAAPVAMKPAEQVQALRDTVEQIWGEIKPADPEPPGLVKFREFT